MKLDNSATNGKNHKILNLKINGFLSLCDSCVLTRHAYLGAFSRFGWSQVVIITFDDVLFSWIGGQLSP